MTMALHEITEQGALPADWLVPQWPAPDWVRAVASSRAGGVSLAPYNSMNLGDHVQDDPAAVARNRQIWQQVAGVSACFCSRCMVWMLRC